MVDTLGDTQRVLVIPPVLLMEAEQSGQDAPVWLAQVKMAVFEAETLPGTVWGVGVYGTSLYGGEDIYG